jgi:hypothetical protein
MKAFYLMLAIFLVAGVAPCFGAQGLAELRVARLVAASLRDEASAKANKVRAQLAVIDQKLAGIREITKDQQHFDAWLARDEAKRHIANAKRERGIPDWTPVPARAVKSGMLAYAEGLERDDRPALVKRLAELDEETRKHQKEWLELDLALHDFDEAWTCKTPATRILDGAIATMKAGQQATLKSGVNDRAQSDLLSLQLTIDAAEFRKRMLCVEIDDEAPGKGATNYVIHPWPAAKAEAPGEARPVE